MEAVFAAFFGYLLLGELLAARQFVGCAMILGAILIVQQNRTRDS
jgi:drug/metabolite transporter (DMT)-like permease